MSRPPYVDRYWHELDRQLDLRGLKLVDISKVSSVAERRTPYSLSYLSNLRTGMRGYPRPNARAVKIIADAIGCTIDDLKRAPVAVVSA